MKSNKIVVLFVIFIFLFECLQCEQYNLTTKYIDVPIDHFSFTNNATFKLKYLINDTFFFDNGPIFFYTGNEGNIETFAQNTGFMFDIAPNFHAIIIFAEHRYYGSSLPFGNSSYNSTKYLGYLSSSQALADYVYLIDTLQNKYSTNKDKLPVIAFGGSYGGMLAAWLRMKYPASVIGAIASSAPIWQFNGLTPCENFNRILTSVYKIVQKKDCTYPIKKLWSIIRNLSLKDDGKKLLFNKFKLCNNLKTKYDINALINWISDIITNMAMVNYPYSTSFLVPLPPRPVWNFCQKLNGYNISDDLSLITAISASLEIYTNYTKKTDCNKLSETSGNLGEKGWYFQACTEMIMPMCSTKDDMFEETEWNYNKYQNECRKKFNISQPLENLPILMYGGKNIASASNIVFSNGMLDPWSSGGVLNNVSTSILAFIIPDAAHHLDLRGSHPDDPYSVKQAREFHINAIKTWISTFYNK